MPTLPAPFWRSIESLHHFIYLVPEARTHYAPTGLKGSWMGYFASRSAALGTPSPELVIATFHGFAPRMVHRALPDAGALASRDDIHEARLGLAREILGRAVTDEQMAPLADALTTVVGRLDLAGKSLAAAHASLPVPADVLGRFWHANAVIREYRGDCHIAVLVAAGLDGAEANVLNVAASRTFPAQQKLRGWTDDEWAAAGERLRQRDWLDDAGTITEGGTSARDGLESATDRACDAGVSDEAADAGTAIADDLRTAARALKESLKG